MESFFIQTFGCQMNVHDSQKIKEQLQAENYIETQDMAKADIIIANTCSVRHNPENKVYSFVGRIRQLKEKKKILLAIAAGISQEVRTLEDMSEPFLLQEGFLTRTPRGRAVTQKAYDWFNKTNKKTNAQLSI